MQESYGKEGSKKSVKIRNSYPRKKKADEWKGIEDCSHLKYQRRKEEERPKDEEQRGEAPSIGRSIDAESHVVLHLFVEGGMEVVLHVRGTGLARQRLMQRQSSMLTCMSCRRLRASACAHKSTSSPTL